MPRRKKRHMYGRSRRWSKDAPRGVVPVEVQAELRAGRTTEAEKKVKKVN
jgi:hypothetical protein